MFQLVRALQRGRGLRHIPCNENPQARFQAEAHRGGTMERYRFALLLLVCAGACSHANKSTETVAKQPEGSPPTVHNMTPKTNDWRMTEVVTPEYRPRGEMATVGAIPDTRRPDNAATEPPSARPAGMGAPTNSNAQGVTPMDQSENESDLKLTRDVRQALVDNDALSFGAKNVIVVTRGGTVTLRGTVSSRRERNLVLEAARARVGVLRVVDQLKVSK